MTSKPGEVTRSCLILIDNDGKLTEKFLRQVLCDSNSGEFDRAIIKIAPQGLETVTSCDE